MIDILNHPLSIFLITLIISFMGSVQPGVVNIMASRLVLTHGRRHALIYSGAAALPEILYAFIAAYYMSKIKLSDAFQITITAVAGFVLILFGIYVLFNPPKVEIQKGRFDHPVLKGLFLSITNPQLIIFWSGMIVIYKNYSVNFQDNLLGVVMFSLGAGVGAFLLLMAYMKLSEHYLKDWNARKIIFLNKISAYILILIGIIATLGLLF